MNSLKTRPSSPSHSALRTDPSVIVSGMVVTSMMMVTMIMMKIIIWRWWWLWWKWWLWRWWGNDLNKSSNSCWSHAHSSLLPEYLWGGCVPNHKSDKNTTKSKIRPKMLSNQKRKLNHVIAAQQQNYTSNKSLEARVRLWLVFLQGGVTELHWELRHAKESFHQVKY